MERPSLLKQIKTILDEYPDDGQIIKELVQNADDAGATRMSILYDGRNLNEATAGEKKYKRFFRAPAMVVYNDAEFNQEDWKGIKMIYNSVKADDPLKIGRFGLGFKSVFHLTDNPCIISGNTILFLNPLEKPERVCVTMRLKSLVKCKRLHIKDCIDSLSGTFGFNEDTLRTGNFNGSLFWFPLRNKPSDMSDNLYTESKIMDLFKAFMSDSEKSLLFLKSLQRLGMSSKAPERAIPAHIKDWSIEDISLADNLEFFSVEIDNDNNTLHTTKMDFMKKLRRIPKQSVHCIFDVTVSTRQKRKSCEDKISKSRWLIVNYLKGGELSDRLNVLVQDKALSYHPFLGIAAPIHEPDVDNQTDDQINGHVFCFQPLPQEKSNLTGLPVHVNAFFAVSQNRRHLKVRCKMHTDKAIDCNLTLISEVLPEAYVKLHEHMIELSDNGNNPTNLVTSAYNMIPNPLVVDDRWKLLAEEFIKLVTSKNILFTKKGNGNWISVNEAIVTLKVDEQRNIDTVIGILQSDNISLTQIPENAMNAIKNTNCIVTEISPSFVADHFKQFETYKQLSPEDKENLIEYLCPDTNCDRLEALELLPLQNGTFTTFKNGPIVVLEELNVVALFPGEEEKFVSCDIREHSYNILSTLIQKGQYQVRHLHCDLVIDLLKHTLEDNFGNVRIVEVDKVKATVWKEWIKRIWNYIEVNYNREVSKFCDLPLFPVTSKPHWNSTKSFQLHPLSGLLLLEKYNSYQLNKDVCHSFKLLSVTIIKTIPDWMPHDLVQPYLHNGSCESIIRLLECIDASKIDVFNDQSTDEQRYAIVSFLSSTVTSSVTSKAKNLLSKLLLFREYKAVSSEPKWVSPDNNRLIFDEREFPIVFPTFKLRTHSPLEKAFAMHLGCRTYSQSEMVLETMEHIASYTKDEVKQFMYWFLRKRLYKENKEAHELAKHIRFLEDGDTQLHTPNALFDLSDILVAHLFRDENVLPVDEMLRDDDYIYGLRSLGLKTRKDITSADIETTCRIIHEMSTGTIPIDTVKSTALIECLEENIQLLSQCNVNGLKCIIVRQERMESYPACLPFYYKDADISLCAPSELRSSTYANLIGSVVPVIDCQSISGIAKHFGWSAAPELSTVVRHMSVVIETYKSEHKSTLLPIISNIYVWLSFRDIQEVKSALSAGRITLEIQHLGYIWIGDGFVSTDRVYVESRTDDIDLRPFFNVLPSELQHMKAFFIDLGCARQITMDTYIDTIEMIKNASEQIESTQIPISKMRHMVINILTKLKEDFHSLAESDKTIYFPIHTGDEKKLIMRPAKQCTFCDAQWLKDVDFVEEDDGKIYVHIDVSNATAEALGVPSLTQQILSDTEALEECGQEESLTRRLNCLLKEGYVDGFSIPKELCQNADDAGASKLWIMYDERENNDARVKLLSEGMAECQGPALWVYNDAEFTEEDFKNITKLNGATKEEDSSKIGKFGLGFCSVYNITDVPSFVSGENMLIFDPHTTFLGKALPGKSPGIRLNLGKVKNIRMMKRISNQFKPYENVFGCKLVSTAEPYFKGTLFRFPLRTRGSEISDVIYTPQEVIKLITMIVDMSANMLLFNQNVTELQLFHLAQNEKDPTNAKLLYQVHKASRRLLPKMLTFQHSILQEASARKRNRKMKDNPIRIIDEISISTSNITEGQTFETSWLVSWATGRDEKSLALTYNEVGALPLGSIAVPVNITEHDQQKSYCPISISALPKGFYTNSHLFFFMPLPITHAFRFHINCPFAVSSDRRQLRATTEDDKSTRMKEWNESLLSDSAVIALLYMLENMSTLAVATKYMYYQLWPEQDEAPLVKCVPQSFYRHNLRSGSFRVFESRGSWYDISKCVFLDPALRNINGVGEFAFHVLLRFSTDQTAVDIPQKYYKLLYDTDMSVVTEHTITTELFLLKYFFPNLLLLGVDKDTKRNEVLKFAVHQSNPKVQAWLCTHDCIPTRPNGILKKPSELIQMQSEIAVLFTVAFGRFPISGFDDKKTSQRLQELGMMHDFLTDSLVIDRAETIKPLNDSKCSICAIERCSHLLAYLSKKLSNHKRLVDTLRSIPVLPVLERPKTWPFQWKGNDAFPKTDEIKSFCKKKGHTSKCRKVFVKPSELYEECCTNLVGCLALIVNTDACTTKLQGIRENQMFGNLMKDLGIHVNIDSIDVSTLALQLETVMTTYTPNPTANISPILDEIYTVLEKHCNSEENKAVLANRLSQKRIVWVSNVFITPSEVALDQESCPPYLYGLHNSKWQNRDHLCQTLGIQKYFGSRRIAFVLQEVFRKSNGAPLHDNDLKMCLKLLEMLHENMQRKKVTNEQLLKDDTTNDSKIVAIYAPDDEKILRDATTMCFDDYNAIEKSDTMIFVHDRVSKGVAKAFGVKPKQIQHLEDNSEDIEDFYQNEPLLTRLHGLLDGYPCDGIFKELLQNADDAGATEIQFLNDTTTHGTCNIFGDNFGPLQGPALCVYNNSAFTQQDLKGIQMLGRGSKSDDPSKTGQYGVGFNAVYNLTDAPSFLTKGVEIENGETLCMFDPMAKYVPQTTKTKPGKRYKNVNTIREHQKDVLKGYHENHFFNTENGTVFRFPLRTKIMAVQSEIKKDCVNTKTITAMFKTFSVELSEMLIFLRNLKKVTLSTYTRNGYRTDQCVEVILSDTDSSKRREYDDHQKRFKQHRDLNFQVMQTKTVDYEMSITEKDGRIRKYLVVQSIGYNDIDHVPIVVKEKVAKGLLGLLPQAGVAVLLNDSGNTLPTTPASATEMTQQSKAFCFLPLPIDTGLPVHVHGHFALDHETRRSLWKSEQEHTCYKTQWNLSLIRNVIAPAYIVMLNRMKETLLKKYEKKEWPSFEVKSAISTFEKLFPLDESASDFYWKKLTTCVYLGLVNGDIAFLPIICRRVYKTYSVIQKQTQCVAKINVSWTSLKPGDYSYPAYHNDDRNDLSLLNEILRNIGMRIVTVSKGIRKSMKIAGVRIGTLSPILVTEYLCSYDKDMVDKCNVTVDCKVENTSLASVSNVRTVIEYCKPNTDWFLQRMVQLPLFITQDCVLRRVNKDNPIFVTRFNNLFPNELHRFLHTSLCDVLNSLLTSKQWDVWGILNQFTIQSFISLLDISELEMLRNKSILGWNRQEPNQEWIKNVWTFFWQNIPTPNFKFEWIERQREEQRIIAENLALLGDWALLPVVEEMHPEYSKPRTHLLPVMERGLLIYLNSFPEKQLKKALRKMCKFQIDESCLLDRHTNTADCNIVGKIQEQIPSYLKPTKVLNCLILNLDKGNSSNLEIDEAMAVLQYISANLNAIVESGDIDMKRKQIQRLPIFKTHYEKVVSLCNCRKVYIVPSEMPYEDLENISTKTDIVVLRAGLLNKDMLSFLAVTESAIIDIYINYIIPVQHLMNRQAFYNHVEFLAMAIFKSDVEEDARRSLVSCITDVRFIQTAKGMKRVNEFFDHRNNVFREMCQEWELVPKELQKNVFIDIFKLLGLQNNVTMELYSRYAANIAEDGIKNGLSETVKKRSNLLLKSFLGMPTTFLLNESFNRLREIHFIVPEKADDNHAQIHEQYNSEKLIPFAESVPRDQIDICWTTANILPNRAYPQCVDTSIATRDIIIEKLQICANPIFGKFITHCKNVGSSLSMDSSMLQLKADGKFEITVRRVMESIYDTFKQFNENGSRRIDTDILSQLTQVPMIYFPEEKMVLKASCAVNNCQDDEQIPPYVQRSPAQFGKYFDVFLLLGASKQPSCGTYARVLHTLKLNSNDDELLPSELTIAKLAISNLLAQIGKHSVDTEIQVASLFLPNSERKMQEAKCVVVCDNAYFKRRLANNAKINFFLGFDENIREDEAIDKFKRIPHMYRPAMLTEIVGEKVQLPDNSQTCYSVANEVAEFLHCNQFISGIVRLIKHITKLEKRAFSTVFEKRVSHKLRNIEVRRVEEINTVLTLKKFENGSFVGTPKIVANTTEKKAVHIEEIESCTWIYFETSKREWYDDVKYELTVYLNKIADSCNKIADSCSIGNVLIALLLPLLLNQKDTPENIADILDKHKVDQYDMAIEETDPLFPKPGTFVPVKFHAYLDNDYGLIHEHDYKFMVYEVEDPAIPEVVSNNHEEGETSKKDNMNKTDRHSNNENYLGNESEEDEEAQPTYIYCRILQLVKQNDTFPLFQKYKVDIGEETPINVPAYKLYKFKRKRSASNDSSTDLVAFGTIGSVDLEHNKSLKEVYKEIRAYLIEAWKRHEKKRRHIVKRLLLKWHPDKNPDNGTFCTKVFQYIQQCLRKLERGLTLTEDDDIESDYAGYRAGSSGSFPRSRSRKWNWYDAFFTNMGQRYRRQRNTYDDDSQGYSESYRESEREPYHYYAEARRWQKQAAADFKSANASMENLPDPSYNWVCYKYNQAAEKSLKAAWYAKDANKIAAVKYKHQLYYIAQGLDPQLGPLAGQLNALTGAHTRMRYPDMHSLNTIPATAYHRKCTLEVRDITEKILNIVASVYKC